jgi:hypothetical protein
VTEKNNMKEPDVGTIISLESDTVFFNPRPILPEKLQGEMLRLDHLIDMAVRSGDVLDIKQASRHSKKMIATLAF